MKKLSTNDYVSLMEKISEIICAMSQDEFEAKQKEIGEKFFSDEKCDIDDKSSLEDICVACTLAKSTLDIANVDYYDFICNIKEEESFSPIESMEHEMVRRAAQETFDEVFEVFCNKMQAEENKS